MDTNSLLKEELQRKRSRLRDESRQKEKPLVFSDTDLATLVSKKPRTKEELNQLVKIDYRYQQEILDIINAIGNNEENFCDLMVR